MNFIAAFIIACTSLAFVASRSAYELPADSQLLLRSSLVTSFSCAGRPYGYYADVANNCQLFHVCYPINDDIGNIIEEAQFTFICGNQTVFDQEFLTCGHARESFPCNQAENIYDLSNRDFGRIPEHNFNNNINNNNQF